MAGYGLPLPEAARAGLAPRARAVVLAAGDMKVGLVSLELMLVPDALVAAVRERTASLGLGAVVVVATHTHSSFGGYDARLAAQLGGTGRFREASLKAAVEGASEALRRRPPSSPTSPWRWGRHASRDWCAHARAASHRRES
ncbi:hypothetical protein ACN28S_00905 [Cystobacter fuscus]